MSWLPPKYAKCNAGPLSNFSNFEGSTNFTLAQFKDYVQWNLDFTCFILPVMDVLGLSGFVVSGVVGLVANLLMFFTLKKVSISECSLIYHKAMVVMEVVHMLIMINHGIICLAKLNFNNLIWGFWAWKMSNGWVIGDGLKLAVSTMSALLALERVIAVCFMMFFSKINKKSVAYCAVGLSIFVGTAHFWQFFTQSIIYDQKVGLYTLIRAPFASSLFYAFVVNFIYFAKICLSLWVFIFSIATAVALKLEQKKLPAMNRDQRKNWRSKRRACTLSYLLGGTVLFDHTVWLIHKITIAAAPGLAPEVALTTLTYEGALENLVHSKLGASSGLMQRLAGQFVHSWRFFIYLAFNQPIRNGFKRAFGKAPVAPTSMSKPSVQPFVQKNP